MKANLYINHNPEKGWELATTENCNIPEEFHSVECDSVEDWGCPNGGVTPIKNGERVGFYSFDGEEIYLNADI